MPQFPMSESRRSILERIPDYAVEISVAAGRIVVRHGETMIASSERALLVRETRHDEVYYLPQEDVRMALLVPTDLSTYCPFKGHASYWSMKHATLESFVWGYLDPYPEVAALKDYLSFYTDKVEVVVE